MRPLMVLLAMLASAGVYAQTYPAHPIRLVIPFAPGGSTDLGGRLVALGMTEILGQSIVVDNRAGAGGVLGTDVVAKAAPDGYTLAMATSGTFGINPSLYPSLPYDPQRAFDPVGQISSGALTFVIAAERPQKTLAEFAQWAQSHSGTVNFASSGSGTPPHLLAVLFNQTLNIRATHIPFKGGAPALAATMAGQTDYDLDVVPTSLQQMRAGRIRILAVTTPARVAMLPEVPTVAEAGYGGLTTTIWNGLVAPAGTPRPVIERLNAALVSVLRRAEVRQRFADLGIEPAAASPESFGALLQEELARWAPLVKQSGATVD